MESWGPVISFLLAVIVVLLGIVGKHQNDFNKQTTETLKGKQEKEDCREHREKCSHGPSWDVFDKHSHTGLAPDAKVTR